MTALSALPEPYKQTERFTLYQGDCREILPLLPHVDLIVTDPPYGIGLEYASYDDSRENWHALMDDVVPLMRKAADMVIMPSCGIDRLPWFYERHRPDWLIAWDKGSPGHLSKVGFNDWEAMLVYGRTRRLSMHDMIRPKEGRPNEAMGNWGHPCPKPLEWAEWLIRNACPAGGTVLDPFAGSGTVGVAAYLQRRKPILVELDPGYCEAIAKRIENQNDLEVQYVQEHLPLESATAP